MASGALVRRLYVEVDADTSRAVAGLGRVDEAGDRASDSLRATQRRADLLGDGMMAAGATAGGLALALGAVAQQGMTVEQRFAEVRATTGATESEMAAMQAKAQELGQTMPASASEVAGAFRYLSFAGMEAEESIASVDAVARLAAGSQMNMAQSARTVASNLNAFQMEADKAGSVASGMAATFASSDVELGELSETLSYVGSSAQAAGQNLTTVNAAAGVLADNGMRGTRSGTAMAAMLDRLADPSGKAAEALTTLGLSVDDFTNSEGDLKSLDTVVATLSESMEGMGGQERLRTLTRLFGRRGARAASLLTSNVDALDKKLSEVSAANVAEAISALEGAEDSVLQDRTADLGVSLSSDMDTGAVLEQYEALSSEVSQKELARQIEVGLQVGPEASEFLAGELASGTSTDELAKSLESATTAGDLASAKMETLGGRVKFLVGSVQAFAQGIYQGARPALMALTQGAIGLVNGLNSVPGLAKATGVGMVALASAATVAAGALGVMYVQTKLAAAAEAGLYAQTSAYTGLLAAKNAATRAAAAAKYAYTAALYGNLTAVTRNTAASARNALASYRSAAASKASAAAERLATTATNARTIASNAAAAAKNVSARASSAVTAATLRERAAKAGATFQTYASAAANRTVAGAKWLATTASNALTGAYARNRAAAALAAVTSVTLSGALGFVTAGFTAAAASAYAFLAALGPIGWVAIAGGALLAGAALSDLDGTLDAIIGPLQTAASVIGGAVGWTLDLASGIVNLAMAVGGLALDAAVITPLRLFYDLVNGLTGGGVDAAASSLGDFAGAVGAVLRPVAELPGYLDSASSAINDFSVYDFVSSLPENAAEAAGRIPDAIMSRLGGFDLGAHLGKFSWAAAIPILGWAEFIPGFSWSDHVPTIPWEDLVPDLDLADSVEDVDLSSHVMALVWPGIAPIRLAEYVTGVDLSEEAAWNGWPDIEPLDFATLANGVLPMPSLPNMPSLSAPSVDGSPSVDDPTASVSTAGVGASTEKVGALRSTLASLRNAGAPPAAIQTTVTSLNEAQREADESESRVQAFTDALTGFDTDPLDDTRAGLNALRGDVEGAVDGVVSSLATLWPAFEDRFPRTARALETRAEQVGAVVSTMGGALDAAGDSVARSLRPLESWANTAEDTARTVGRLTVGPFVAGVRAVGDAASWAGEQFDRLVETPIENFVSGVRSDVDAARAAFYGFIPSPGEVADDATAFATGVAGSVGDALLTGLDVTLATILMPGDMVPKVASWWFNAGKGALSALADGILSAPDELTDAIGETLGSMLPFLPSSDAERGPLSNLTGRGRSLVITLARGILSAPNAVADAVGSVLGNVDDVSLSDVVSFVRGGGVPGMVGRWLHDSLTSATESVGLPLSLSDVVDFATSGGVPGALARALDLGAHIPDVNLADTLGVGGLRRKLASVLDIGQYLPDIGLGSLLGRDDGESAGSGLVNAMASGVDSAAGALTGAVQGMVDAGAQLLPGSDAERGPLSNLTDRGHALPETVAAGAERAESSVASTLASVFGSAVPDDMAQFLPDTARTAAGVLPGPADVLGGLGDAAGAALGMPSPSPTVNAPPVTEPRVDVSQSTTTETASADEIGRAVAQHASSDSTVNIVQPTIKKDMPREEVRRLLREEGLSKRDIEEILTALFRNGDAGAKPGNLSG